MYISEMRPKMKGLLSGLASNLSDGEVDALLQRAYQYTIPMDVPGTLTDGEWYLSPDSLGAATYPETVHSVKPKDVLISTRRPEGVGPADLESVEKWIPAYFDPDRFYSQFPDPQPNETIAGHTGYYDTYWSLEGRGEPTAILFYQRKAVVRPKPDMRYQLYAWTRNFPVAMGITGLANEAHAMAVVLSAALEFARDLDADEIIAKLEPRYEHHKSRLLSMSLAESPQRRPRRSF